MSFYAILLFLGQGWLAMLGSGSLVESNIARENNFTWHLHQPSTSMKIYAASVNSSTGVMDVWRKRKFYCLCDDISAEFREALKNKRIEC